MNVTCHEKLGKIEKMKGRKKREQKPNSTHHKSIILNIKTKQRKELLEGDATRIIRGEIVIIIGWTVGRLNRDRSTLNVLFSSFFPPFS